MAYLLRENSADHFKSACTEKNARRTLKQQAALIKEVTPQYNST